MPWFKVDDGFHGHPKVVELSLQAVGLWTLAGTWCAGYLTDGEINLRSIRRLGGDEGQAAELVDAGLWVDGEPGTYHFKDWADYQPLKADVEAERESARERMKNVRAKKKRVQPNTGDGSEDVRPNNPRTFGRSSEEVRVTPTQSQSHPDPTPPSGGVAGGQTGTRIPKDFTLTPEMLRWAQDNTPNTDPRASTRKFTAHFKSVAGRTQFKTDWTAAWEAWLLGDQERATNTQQYQTAAERKLEAGARLHAKYTAIEEQTQQLQIEGQTA